VKIVLSNEANMLISLQVFMLLLCWNMLMLLSMLLLIQLSILVLTFEITKLTILAMMLVLISVFILGPKIGATFWDWPGGQEYTELLSPGHSKTPGPVQLEKLGSQMTNRSIIGLPVKMQNLGR
jgi:hypothetical protein